MSLICSQDGDVALIAQTIAGNALDKNHFKETLLKIKLQTDQQTGRHYFVTDSTLYTNDTLKEISSFASRISRVPEQMSAASQLIHEYAKKDLKEIGNGYFGIEESLIYADVPHRWVLVYSEQAFTREEKNKKKTLKCKRKK